MKCPYCRSKKIQKNGHYKDIQRYRCTNCGKTFKDKNYAIKTKKEKDFIQALYNLLNITLEENSQFYKDLDLSQLVNGVNFRTIPDNISIKYKESDWQSRKRISCRNPKAILCLCDSEIRIVLLPPSELPKDYNGRIKFGINHKPDEIHTLRGRKYIKKY